MSCVCVQKPSNQSKTKRTQGIKKAKKVLPRDVAFQEIRKPSLSLRFTDAVSEWLRNVSGAAPFVWPSVARGAVEGTALPQEHILQRDDMLLADMLMLALIEFSKRVLIWLPCQACSGQKQTHTHTHTHTLDTLDTLDTRASYFEINVFLRHYSWIPIPITQV